MIGSARERATVAAGLNTYGYAGGDPINFSEPFGLNPCCNLAKLGVGYVNAKRSVATFMSGSAKLVVGGPVAIVGAVEVGVIAPSLWCRGIRQGGEALREDFSDASWKNALGLLPAGQKFDDADEPTPLEYVEELAAMFEEDPKAAVTRLVDDYLVRGKREN